METYRRVLRGGGWNNNDTGNLLSSNRNNDHPDNRNANNGFRLVVVGESRKAAYATQTTIWRGVRWAQGLPDRSQDASLTPSPTPRIRGEKTRRAPWPVGTVRKSRRPNVSQRVEPRRFGLRDCRALAPGLECGL